MPRWKVDDELRGEQAAGTFEPFKNGRLNPHTPRAYNWALGYTELLREDIKRKQPPHLQTPDRRVNGKILRAQQ